MIPATSNRRSKRVTILAWLVIVAAALGTVLSFFAFLMSVSHHYGSSGDVGGFLLVVVAPPVTLAAGIGLLLRKRWARLYLIAVCLILLGATALGIAKGPTPEHGYVSPGGVPTTVLASEVSYNVPLVVISLGVLLLLFSPAVRADFASPKSPPPLPGSPPPARSGIRRGL